MPSKNAVDLRIDEIVRHSIHPFLRERGFIRKGRTWNRDLGEVRHVINIQTDARFERDDLDRSPIPSSFTVNLGVFIPYYYETMWSEATPPSFIKEDVCPIHYRMRDPDDPRQEHWWFVDTATDIETVGRDVANALIRDGLPFVDGLGSLRAILEWLGQRESYHYLVLAVLLLHFQNVDGARRIIEKMPQTPGWQANVGILRQKFGLV